MHTKCCAVLVKSRAQDDRNLFGSDGGCMIPVHSKIALEIRMHFERLVSCYGRKQLIPVNIEDNIFNFFLSKESKSTETNTILRTKNLSSQETSMVEQCARRSKENSQHGPMTLNQLRCPVQMSKWETMKTKTHWKQSFPDQEF